MATLVGSSGVNGHLVGLLGFKPMVRREQRRRSVRFRCTPANFPASTCRSTSVSEESVARFLFLRGSTW